MSSGAYLRVGKENVEIEHLSDEELLEAMEGRSPEELIRWLSLLCETIRELEGSTL